MKSLKIAVIVLAVAVVTLTVLLWVTNREEGNPCHKDVPVIECCGEGLEKSACGKHGDAECAGLEKDACGKHREAECGKHGDSECCKQGDCRVNEPALENIMTRTSIRKFAAKPVKEEVITRILKAGMAAPTAVNKQPWAFVVVKDCALLEKLGSEMRNSSMTATAAFAIVVCGDMKKTLNGEAKDFWVQDVSAATQNILLSAHAFGLGAVWTGLYPSTERSGKVASILGLPSNLIPLNIIPIGYPAENPTPKDKWKPENVIVK